MTLQRNRILAVLMAVLLALGTLGSTPAHADPRTDSVTQAADWIAKQWQDQPGQFAGAGSVADGILALSAANTHPDVVQSMLWKLHEFSPKYIGTLDKAGNPAGLAKVIIALDAAGQDPRTFLGPDRDLVKELQAHVEANKPNIRSFWAPYLIAIALSRMGEDVPSAVVDEVLANQQDGAFGYTSGGTFHADPDYTAVGIMAMNLLSVKAKDRAVRNKALDSVVDAIDWAQDPANQKTDANGNRYWGTYSSANSTGMLASALAEVGENVESPVAYLVAQQQLTGTGAWSNVPDGTNSNMMATTQAILAPAGVGYGTVRSTQVPPIDVNPGETPQPDPSPEPTPEPTPTPDPTPEPTPDPTPTPKRPLVAKAAPEKPVGATANAWGTVDTTTPVRVWTEVRLPNGRWSTSQQRRTDATGRFVIPLTYGATTPGTLTWRVGAEHSDGTVQRSAPFTQRRVAPAVTVRAYSAGQKPVGQATNTWGTAKGAPRAKVWTEVRLPNGRWSTSQQRRTDAAGRFVIPLTYGATTPGTTTWRVAVQAHGTVTRSAPFTLVRR